MDIHYNTQLSGDEYSKFIHTFIAWDLSCLLGLNIHPDGDLQSVTIIAIDEQGAEAMSKSFEDGGALSEWASKFTTG